jgi:glycosyltransferase involved in cell wall biosynthesis
MLHRFVARIAEFVIWTFRAALSGPKAFENERQNISIIVATRNSETYISIILDYYERLGVSVHVFVDSSSTDDTFGIASSRKFHRVEFIENKFGRVEAVIEDMSRRAERDWILRLDDDEVPSLALLRFAQQASMGEPCVYGIRRLQCGLSKEGFWAAGLFDNSDHIQWRLYDRREVEFETSLHSAGIVVMGAVFAPKEAFMIHLDWIVHSLDERTAKIESYDRQSPMGGSRWKDFYLIEKALLDPQTFALKASELRWLARGLRAKLGLVPVIEDVSRAM